jgi:CRP-like cAMP-binding protein
MSRDHTPSENLLLAALPAEEFRVIEADLELVPMALGEVVFEPGKVLRHAYFPTTAVVSLHCMTSTGQMAESSGVGREGIVGIALLLGGEFMPNSAVVQNGGYCYRMSRERLQQAFASAGTLRSVLLRYTQVLMAQIGQVAVCYRFHTIEQQLSRWLLSTANRVPPGGMMVTHELVAGLLGVRRESISIAASKLQDGGYIRYRRGNILILDPAGLESRACECYAVVRAEIQRLMQRAPAVACDANRQGHHV